MFQGDVCTSGKISQNLYIDNVDENLCASLNNEISFNTTTSKFAIKCLFNFFLFKCY